MGTSEKPAAEPGEVLELFEDLDFEMWFGCNMRFVLDQATPAERATIRAIVDRAKKERGAR